jgi:type I restriction enzyme M protein
MAGRRRPPRIIEKDKKGKEKDKGWTCDLVPKALIVARYFATELKKQVRDAEAELDQLAYDQYPKLSETDIQSLVIEDKWMAELEKRIHGETERISQQLSQRIRSLAERYEAPLPTLTQRVADLENKVAQHLQTMGFSWN